MAGKKCGTILQERCALSGGVIMYEPYAENIGGKEFKFHAKACADAFKEMGFPHCAYCGGIIAYEPYTETIGGKKILFHTRGCAEVYKKK